VYIEKNKPSIFAIRVRDDEVWTIKLGWVVQSGDFTTTN